MPYAFEKSIFASKTFWVNFVTALIAILTFFVGQDYVANNPSIAPLFVAALSGLNIVLRYITSTAVTLAVLFMLSLAVAGGSTASAEEKFGGYTFDELGCYQPGPNVVRAEDRDDAGAMRQWLAQQRSDYERRLDVIDQKYAPGQPLSPPGNNAGTDEPLVRALRYDAERNSAWEDYKARVGEKEAAKAAKVAVDMSPTPNAAWRAVWGRYQDRLRKIDEHFEVTKAMSESDALTRLFARESARHNAYLDMCNDTEYKRFAFPAKGEKTGNNFAVVDVVSVAGADDVAADFKLPLAPNKPPKVVAVSLARPGYVCDANGCRPVAGAAASACGPGGCRSAARGGKVVDVLKRIFKR